MKRILALTMAGWLGTGAAVAGECYNGEGSQPQTLTAAAAGVDNLVIDAGAGHLQVVGSQGNRIEVEGVLYVGDDTPYEFELQRRGKAVSIQATIGDTGSCWSQKSPYIDVTVRVPAGMVIEVEDSSGSIDIRHVQGQLNVADGSGDIVVTDVVGDAQISDGSGSIMIEGLTGGLRIDDGSGDIRLTKLRGSVDIEDGSGDIHMRQLYATPDSEPVVKINDGSGDIDIARVQDWVSIDDGSGDIQVDRTRGLKVIEGGSGDIKVTNTDQDNPRLM